MSSFPVFNTRRLHGPSLCALLFEIGHTPRIKEANQPAYGLHSTCLAHFLRSVELWASLSGAQVQHYPSALLLRDIVLIGAATVDMSYGPTPRVLPVPAVEDGHVLVVVDDDDDGVAVGQQRTDVTARRSAGAAAVEIALNRPRPPCSARSRPLSLVAVARAPLLLVVLLVLLDALLLA